MYNSFKINILSIDEQELDIVFKFSKETPADVEHNKRAVEANNMSYRYHPETDIAYKLPLLRYFISYKIAKKWSDTLKVFQYRLIQKQKDNAQAAALQKQKEEQFNKANTQELENLYQKYSKELPDIWKTTREKFHADFDAVEDSYYMPQTYFNNEDTIAYLKSLNSDLLKAFFYSVCKYAYEKLQTYDTTYMDRIGDAQTRANKILSHIKFFKEKVKELFGIII